MVSAKWVFTWKADEHGKVVKAKARLVARGFSQRPGVDYYETFAPTPAASCIRMMAAIACELQLDLCHFDVQQAFVQAELQELVLMRMPQGCGDLSGKVMRLNRSLYGLKQASRSWHRHLVTRLKSLSFEQSLADPCVFRLIEAGSVSIIAVVHVDDIFAVGRKERCDRFCEDLNRVVPINNVGELRWYAGCHYSRDKVAGLLTISQKSFAEKTVKQFGVTTGRNTPLSPDLFLEVFDEEEPTGDWPYRELVGSLLWLSNQTRPDISNAVRAVARYMHAPKLKHWLAARGILEYLKVTSSYGITFQRGSGLELVVYADAAYAPRDTRRKSVSGAAVMCGGAAIQWISRTQKTSTLSTSEAEYVAMAEGFKEALFLRSVWRFLLPDFGDPCIQVFEDNKGAIQIAVNPVTNSNSKHIDVRHHFLRELVEKGEFEITHVRSEYEHADFLTKPLPKDAFRFHRNFIMNMS